jgi:hypothetical protein
LTRPEGSNLRIFELVGFDGHRIISTILQESDFDGLALLQVSRQSQKALGWKGSIQIQVPFHVGVGKWNRPHLTLEHGNDIAPLGPGLIGWRVAHHTCDQSSVSIEST